MATALAHQRNILEIQKPVNGFLLDPELSHFCQQIRILSRDPLMNFNA
jgi:hypothetical protein